MEVTVWGLWQSFPSRAVVAAVTVLAATACPADDADPPLNEGSSGAQTESETSTSTTLETASATTADPSTTGTPTTTSTTDQTATTGPEQGWMEVGWGIDYFRPFQEGSDFPIYRGTQGLYMFTMGIRGGGFPLPDDPSDFTHPDIPILDVWLDVEGHEITPDGHFIEYTGYPVPFQLDLSAPGEYEYISVWLVMPDTADPAEFEGLNAVLHAELACADGQLLVADHALVVGSVIEP